MSDIYEAGDTLDIKTAQGNVFTITLDAIYETAQDTIKIDWSTLCQVTGDGIITW